VKSLLDCISAEVFEIIEMNHCIKGWQSANRTSKLNLIFNLWKSELGWSKHHFEDKKTMHFSI